MMDGLIPVLILTMIMTGIAAAMWGVFACAVRFAVPRPLAFVAMWVPPAVLLCLLDRLWSMPLPG